MIACDYDGTEMKFYFVTACNEEGYMDLQGYDNTQQLLIGKCSCVSVFFYTIRTGHKERKSSKKLYQSGT